jgi:Cu-Zn family superoxide dismutase
MTIFFLFLGQLTGEAELKDQKGRLVGEVRLIETEDGVQIEMKAWNLPPGRHAFHIHEGKDCDSVGGHYNPHGRKHGFKNPEGPHAGDLPNITVESDGTCVVTLLAPMVSLGELLEKGTCLVVHEKPDDHRTDPAGDSGERLACGAIRKR